MPSKTYSLGLIGYPLGHSHSPQIHGAALRALGISGAYTLYPVSPDTSPTSTREREERLTLDGLLAQLRAGKIHGLNVTIPHKQNVIPLLDKLTPAAQAIGAVNTIFLQNSVLIGDNTDAPGFWRDLQQLEVRGEGRVRFALVLGAGGSARAVTYALLTHGYQVKIAARRVEQGQELCNQLSEINDSISTTSNPLSAIKLSSTSITNIQSPITLIVNTTPIGMHPNENASPWPPEISLPKNAAIYDLVYNPRETLLVKQARAVGLLASTGMGMLVEQAALAFERWTELEAPRNVMRQVVGE
ncbi:shikimate dehydrogenase [Chloroflexota bacterium]